MLSVCRMVLAGVARATPLDDDAVDDLKLVLSEVCGAAIVHAEGGGQIAIGFCDLADALEITVSGGGAGELDLPWLRELCDEIEVSPPGAAGPGATVRFTRATAVPPMSY